MTVLFMVVLPLVVPLVFTISGRREAKGAWIGALAAGAPGMLFGLVTCSFAEYGQFPTPSPGGLGDELGWAIVGFYGWALGSLCAFIGGLLNRLAQMSIRA